MTKKTTKTTRSLLSDIRGASEFTQMIILTVALALGGLAAVKALSGAVGEKMNTTGEAVKGIN